MALESAADRKAYMSTFGTTVKVGASTFITAIYDDPYLLSLDVSTSMPMIHCVTADISGVTYGTAIVVSGSSFTGTVGEIQHDGTGMSTLILRRTA